MTIVTLLCAFLAAVAVSPAALAQSRGNSGLPSGPGNPLAAPGASGGLGVFDADEKKIGDVVGVQDNIPWVALTVDGQVVVLQAFPDQLTGHFLWYTGPDCSGTVYISGAVLRRGPSVFPIAGVQEPGGVVYAADGQAQPQEVIVRSVFPQSMSPYIGKCFTYPWSFKQNVVPAEPLMTLDDFFTRPYSVH
ncbi:MAG: hypothetical protein HY729_10780 [Candidatus Rokubacteria bacterium]|nr:hypothetical protein [Candidatus Rokubacteria bacterium]